MTNVNKRSFAFQNLPIRYKVGLPLMGLGSLSLFLLIFSLVAYYNQWSANILVIGICVVFLVLLASTWLIILNYLDEPIKHLGLATQAVLDGNEEVEFNIEQRDEIGKIANSTKKLAHNIHLAQQFSQKIGNGHYEMNGIEGEIRNKESGLFASLIQMRDQLKSISEQDEIRNWVTQGLASFSKTLRANDISLQELCQKVIRGLAQLIELHHGGVFILKTKDKQQYLELLATYAYDERQFKDRKVLVEEDFAEGLVGQVFLEREPIHLKNIPAEYLSIASGLGDSNAQSIYIIPLEINQEVAGVLEIAALREFKEHEIELIGKLAENIASAIVSLQVNEKTRRLLEESQTLTSQLQSQEEELRENYEELKVTQEEVGRQNQLIATQKTEIEKALAEQTEKSEMLEAQEEEMRLNMETLVATQEQMMETQAELDGQLNAINKSSISKAEFDLDGNILEANQSFCELLGIRRSKIKEQDYHSFADPDFVKSEEYEKFWKDLRKGVSKSGEYKLINSKQEVLWVNAIYSTVFNKQGKAYKIIQLAFDISQSKKLLAETQLQAQVLKEQEQELRKNMSELELTQKELNRKSEAIIELKEEEAQNARLRAKEIEDKNHLITSSIQYAQNIQSAILPRNENIHKEVQDHFVIFLPKDIVSGDFYWFTSIQNRSFFAAVDCTGHGVPGAFMSIIGNTILNEIVNVQHVYDPGKILELLHIGVRTKLRQAETSNHDGMDIVICSLEYQKEEKVKVKFAGAKRPMYYIHNEQLMELHGDRKSIGGWQREKYRTFTSHEIELVPNDLIYLSTDGIVDNPNNRRKKFGVKKLKDIITQNAHKSMEEQRGKFLEAIIDHQQEAEQRDDITLFALKV